ncbi:MAG: LysR family transcriptional regulator [Ruminococcus sp.]|nr:LysR family transcriptional regulator [Ruminococcus sp.]
MINLELYRIFYIVAVTKNITRASEELHISQPAVTKQLKNLENMLGNPLFIRTKKGVVLNEFGEKIFLKVKQSLSLLDDCEKELSIYKDNNIGTIKIGISTTLTRKYLLSRLAKFHKLYPSICIDIYTDPTEHLLKELKNGQIDFIISKLPSNLDNDFNYIKLGETKYIFVASKDYKSLINKEITITELVKYPIILPKMPANGRINADKYFKENNLKVIPKMNIASSNLLIDFVKIGYGVGYVTKLYVEEELKNKILFEINVKNNTPNISYGIIMLKNNILANHINKFIEFLKEN